MVILCLFLFKGLLNFQYTHVNTMENIFDRNVVLSQSDYALLMLTFFPPNSRESTDAGTIA